MLSLKIFLIIFFADFSVGSLLSVQNIKNQNVSLYVKNLILDLNIKEKNIHDVAVIPLIKSQKIQDMVEDVCQGLSGLVPVHLPPSSTISKDCNLRVSSFIIFISDVSIGVSRKRILNEMS